MSNLRYASPRQYSNLSRYSTLKQIVDTDNGETYLESQNRYTVNDENVTYHVVEPNEEGRLDIISQKYYGSQEFFWLIADANNIVDPFTIIEGSILKIPDISSIYYPGGPLVSRV